MKPIIEELRQISRLLEDPRTQAEIDAGNAQEVFDAIYELWKAIGGQVDSFSKGWPEAARTAFHKLMGLRGL